MKQIELETFGGNHISRVIDEALQMAKQNACIVYFMFNSIKVSVKETTNKEHLLRDYDNAFVMDWKEIGPDCEETYPKDLLEEMEELKAIQKAKSALDGAKYTHEEGKKKRQLTKVIAGTELLIKDKDLWEKGKSNNTDGYGGAIYEFAENWGKLMQVEMSNGKALADIASEASHKADTVGLTGFMYGAAVSVLSACWEHGEELRKWHNKEWGVSEDKEGVVNPAILTISK